MKGSCCTFWRWEEFCWRSIERFCSSTNKKKCCCNFF